MQDNQALSKYIVGYVYNASLPLIQRCKYRGEKKGLQILLSYSQAGPGRKAKQSQEEILSRNHVPTLFLGYIRFVSRLKTTATNHATMEAAARARPNQKMQQSRQQSMETLQEARSTSRVAAIIFCNFDRHYQFNELIFRLLPPTKR